MPALVFEAPPPGSPCRIMTIGAAGSGPGVILSQASVVSLHNRATRTCTRLTAPGFSSNTNTPHSRPRAARRRFGAHASTSTKAIQAMYIQPRVAGRCGDECSNNTTLPLCTQQHGRITSARERACMHAAAVCSRARALSYEYRSRCV
jgi:hypothetical protein